MQLLPIQPASSAIAAGAATIDSTDKSESFLTLSPQVRTNRKNRSPRLFCCRPSGRTALLQITAGHGPMSGTIRAALDGVAQTFLLNKLESPIHDAVGRPDPLLALQLKKYADDDPGPTPQQAVPLEVMCKVRSWTRNEMDVAIGQLVVVAFFFAMQSCEYSDVGSGKLSTVVRTKTSVSGRTERL